MGVNYTRDRQSLTTSGRGKEDLFSSNNISKSGNQNQILKAVVIDCIADVSKYDNDYLSRIQNIFESSQFENRLASIANSLSPKDGLQQEFHLKAPRNSLILRLIDNSSFTSEDKKGNFNQLIVAYPFFSSHIMLPCKPGEIVWCINDVTANGSEYYWLSRIHGQEYVEDANYTHLDRSELSNHFTQDEYKNYIDDFPNGGSIIKSTNVSDDNTKITLPFQEDDSNPFDKIFKNSIVKNINLEPVPRITPKVGDLILQGSNNNAIILTTNRLIDSEKKSEPGLNSSSNLSEQQLDPFNGCIDLVVGRGRFPNQTTKVYQDIFEDLSKNPIKNSEIPRIYKNTRDYYETEKNSIIKDPKSIDKSNVRNHANEGDPDLIRDSSRIYLSNKLDIDKSLGLTEKYPKIVLASSSNNSPNKINFEEKINNSVALVKADEIRIVARKDDENQINGSIKIIKEGNRESNGVSQDQAVIILEKDGSILIDGPKILIGTGKNETNGGGTQISLGYEAKEPLVLGNSLVEEMKKIIDEIAKLYEINSNLYSELINVAKAAVSLDPTLASTITSSTEKIIETKNKSEVVKNYKNNLPNILSTIGKTL